MAATATATVLAPFGPLRSAWTVDTDCADCLHAAYSAAIRVQGTGEYSVTVHHGAHTATATS